ncbi:putative pirin-like protein [Mycobacterium kansasii]|uniref:Putative pirin-like protein n=1 Tax=Mycobacterium kansasii TaxID=1768 RepID=A0A1V3WVK9_MYCKA|nr:putative pirin-like protein [Mycobacterium kansasii]OOK71004.1 putative pirin-like protein [Mycobacterium kansasii]
MAAPGADATERPVRSITSGPRGYEGEGFPVVRAFAGIGTAALDPFVHMDQIGEVDYQPGEPRAPTGTRTGASKPSPT